MQKADEIIERLTRIEKMLEKQRDKPMGFNAAARYLGLSKSYLYKLTSRREIKFYCPKGKKIYFKKSDLDAYLLRNPIKTADEIEQEAIDYVALDGKGK